MSSDEKVNMTLDDIIKMDRRKFNKGPGSVHSVTTTRSNYSRISQSNASQRSWGSQRSRVPFRNRSSSRGRRSRSRTPARRDLVLPNFQRQNHRTGNTFSMPVDHQRKKMFYRHLTPSGMKYQMLRQHPKQSNGSYHFQGFQRRDGPYNQGSMWARVQYAKNRVRLAKKTLNRSQQIYVQQLKELQKQFINDSRNYNTSPQSRFRNGYRKDSNILNPEPSLIPKQSLTVCIKNELALRNWSREPGGKTNPNRSNLNKGNIRNQPAGKIFKSPANIQKSIVYKNRVQPFNPYVNENESDSCPGVAPWDSIMISVPSVTGSSLNERFSNK